MKVEKCQKWDSNPRRENPTATWTQRLRPLGHPDILRQMLQWFTLLITINYCVKWKGKMSEVGFEPRREKPTATWTQRLRPLMIDHPDILRDMLFYFLDYSYCVKWKRKNVRSGIRTHAGRNRLRPERSALDRSWSTILIISDICYFTLFITVTVWNERGKMSEVGFEPTLEISDCDLNAAP